MPSAARGDAGSAAPAPSRRQLRPARPGTITGEIDMEAVLDVDEAARQALQLAGDALAANTCCARSPERSAWKRTPIELTNSTGQSRGQPPHHLEIEVAAIVVPPVLAANADDAVELADHAWHGSMSLALTCAEAGGGAPSTWLKNRYPPVENCRAHAATIGSPN